MSAECRVPLWEELIPTPPFLERVRKGLKAKRLKGKMLYTENERVRKRMKTKDGFFGERAGLNTESAEVAENKEEAQGRAGPPRRAGARTGRRFPIRSEPSREKRKWAVEALGKL